MTGANRKKSPFLDIFLTGSAKTRHRILSNKVIDYRVLCHAGWFCLT